MVSCPLVIELFGTPRISAGSPLALPTRKALGLVAVLAVDGPASRARVAELLWTGRSPDDARRNLRQELHRLHATPVGDALHATGDMLELDAAAEIDVRRFREALEAGDLDEALALYGGPLLAQFDARDASGLEAWLQVERTRLARAWRTAAARRAGQLKAAGRLEAALALVRRLVDDDPLDEAHQREAMELLQRLGDLHGALEQYEACRRTLATELAVEPTADTTALARWLVDPGAVGSDRASPDLTAPLIGREAAWNALDHAGGRLGLILGAAGVGKTRLAGEFARAHGRVLALRGREVSRDTPFYPVAEALLEAYQADSRWFDLLDPVWRAEVTRLLPLLADDEAASPLPAAEARGRLIEGLFAALVTAAQGGSILFDDLHWFDAPSAELVAHLTRKATHVRLLATARSEDVEHNVAVQAALASVERDDKLVRVRLEPLDEYDVLKLVRAMSGSTGARVFAHRLHDATAGNPLFILEMLRDLFSAGVLRAAHGTWETPYDEQTQDYRELPITRTVREAVLRRIDRLGSGVRQLLDAGSLAGDGFRLAWLSECTSLSELECVAAVDRATAAEVLVEAPSGHRFVHDLIRRSLDGALSGERRKLLHRRLAAAMIRDGAPPAEIARHLESAGRAREAIEHRVNAALEAERVHALPEALGQYRMALADGAAGSTAFRIHSSCVELCRNLGDEGGRRIALTAMRALCDAAGDARLQLECAIKQIVDHFEHDRYDDALRTAIEVRQRLQSQLDPMDEAALLLELGATLKALGRLDEAEAHLREALERYRGASPLKFANCAYWLCQCALERGDVDAAEALCDLSLSSGEQAGYRRGHALTMRTSAEIALLRGDRFLAIERLEAALREASEIGSRALQRGFLESLVAQLRAAGRLDEAARRQRELDALAGSERTPL